MDQPTGYIENTAEQAVLEQGILENIPEIVVQYDSEMRVIWANTAARSTGDFIDENLRHKVEDAIQTGLPQQVRTYDLDGNFRLVRCYPVLNSNSEVVSAMMFALKLEMDSDVLRDSEIRNFHSPLQMVM